MNRKTHFNNWTLNLWFPHTVYFIYPLLINFSTQLTRCQFAIFSYYWKGYTKSWHPKTKGRENIGGSDVTSVYWVGWTVKRLVLNISYPSSYPSGPSGLLFVHNLTKKDFHSLRFLDSLLISLYPSNDSDTSSTL